jgi:hypothetical protein
MTATVDGNAWSAIQIQGVNSGTLVSIAGSDAALLSIGFAFQDLGPGTYPIGLGQITRATVTQSSSTVWSATSGLGSGSVTLTTTTNNRAIGTFEFVAELSQGTGDATRTITSGAFDVTY